MTPPQIRAARGLLNWTVQERPRATKPTPDGALSPPLFAVLLVGRLQPVLTFGREIGKRFHECREIATRHRPETGWVESDFEHESRFIQAMAG